MSKKYNEIMDQVRVTDEMKQRILQNVKEGIETEKIPESGKIIHSPMAGLPGIFPLQPVS